MRATGNHHAPRTVILLPSQIDYVRNLVQWELNDLDGEFEGACGYIYHYDSDEAHIPRSAFWDAVCYLEQEGECSIDMNCVETYDNVFAVWVC